MVELGAARSSPAVRIALVGKQRSGKSEAANALVKLGFQRRSLADPVKDDVVIMLNTALNRHTGSGQSVAHPVITREMIEEHKDNLFREILRWYAQEFIKGFQERPDFWMEKFEDWLRGKDDACLVCDDVRHQAEVNMLRDNGFIVIKVVRDEQERINAVRESFFYVPPEVAEKKIADALSHSSEAEVDGIIADLTIYNENPIELHRTIKSLTLGLCAIV